MAKTEAREKIPASLWLLLLVVGSAYMTSRYDFQLSTLTIPQFQASLGMSDQQAAFMTGLVKLGAIPAIFMVFWADKIGRKPVFLWSIIGFSIAAVIASRAQSANALLLGLFLTRLFTMIGELLAIVLIAEAAPPKSRAYMLGILAICGTLGDATAIISYGALGDMKDSWRLLYLLGAIPAVLVIFWRKALKESDAFVAATAEHKAHHQSMNPFHGLKANWKTMAGICLVLFLFWIPVSPALSLLSKHLQSDVGWTQAGVSTLQMGAGMMGFVGNSVGGYLSDRIGRKIVGGGGILLTGLGLAGVYFFASTPFIAGFYAVALLGWFATLVATRAITTESFATEARATATGTAEIAASSAAFAGNVLVAQLIPLAGNTGNAILWLTPIVVLCFCAFLFLKETKGRAMT
ncbi:MAG: major facilitator transporter [Hyphomonadaceae bacterium]|nr:MAG: major facilitator transporter [Hyphomonadaceae bacterium]